MCTHKLAGNLIFEVLKNQVIFSQKKINTRKIFKKKKHWKADSIHEFSTDTMMIINSISVSIPDKD